jgi:hypothetical protein
LPNLPFSPAAGIVEALVFDRNAKFKLPVSKM